MEPTNNKKHPTDSANNEKGNKAGNKNISSNENVIAAHEQAEADIEKDPEFSLPTPAEDLDEEESARLSGDKNDLA